MTVNSRLQRFCRFAIATSVILIILEATPVAAGPANFTRITAGPHVTDGGSSFGASWIDYDNDGWLDIYVTNAYLPSGQNNFLYHNEGDGTFAKITTEVITSESAVTFNHCWADYDDDGDDDLYVGRWFDGTNYLYANNGDGTFAEISTSGDLTVDPGYSTNASWVDIDNDGDLDLYANNEHESSHNYSQANQLYRNDDGIYTRITTGEIVTDVYNSHGMGWSDYDNDGDMDLFVCNAFGPGFQQNSLFRNDGDFSFTKITASPVASDLAVSTGCSWGDYDNDGDQDLYVANSYGAFANFLYRNNGDASFMKITSGTIVTDASWTFCGNWVDYDNDGDLDLFVTAAVADYSSPSKNRLYENNGDNTFTRIIIGDLVSDVGWSWGAAWGDYDRDGDLDVFIVRSQNQNENNLLYRNEGNGNNWLEVHCVGVISNASAIGAKVRAKATIFGQPTWQMREITSATGYCAQHAMSAHFGLGDATDVDSLIVEWPSGIVQNLITIDANQLVTVVEQGQCDCAEFYCDLDISGNITPVDVVLAVNHVYKQIDSRVQLINCSGDNGDWDCSGAVNPSDIVRYVNYVYKDAGVAPCDPCNCQDYPSDCPQFP